MKRNEAAPEIHVDPDTDEVRVDGEKVGGEPLAELPMTQRSFLFRPPPGPTRAPS